LSLTIFPDTVQNNSVQDGSGFPYWYHTMIPLQMAALSWESEADMGWK